MNSWNHPIKHGVKITDEMLKTHYVSKLHLTGIKVASSSTKPWRMSWRITAECKPNDKTEQAKETVGSSKKTKASGSKKATSSKAKAQDSTKAKGKQFIAIDFEVSQEDVDWYSGREFVPVQMM